MEHTYIRDLGEGQLITAFFVLKAKRKLVARNNKPYLDLTFQDRTGTIAGRVWEDADRLWEECTPGEVLRVQGNVDKWQDRLQLRVTRLRARSAEDDVDLACLVPSTEKDVDQMLSYLRGLEQSFTDPHLRSLWSMMFADSDFVDAFVQSAAARALHHGYRGGLLEHTVNMMQMAESICERVYGELNRDLVYVGILFHDIGKMKELHSGSHVELTTEGHLLGHMYLGTGILNRYVAQVPEFPDELLMKVVHIILSHHGEKEWGSPVVPMTPEAVLVHHLDNLDAKTHMALKAIQNDSTDEAFTAYHRNLGRHFFKG